MRRICSFIKMIIKFVLIICLQHYATASTKNDSKRPHIITIIADDLGWNDVGFHGSNQIPTPNIDALAYNGLILNRHYTMPTCTPSRAALLTGRYPIRYGLQGMPITSKARVGLPLNETILPQYLKKLGYVTRLIGKWHLGHYMYEFTPMQRGFDSHFGYYNGWIRYNDSVLSKQDEWGYDAWNNYTKAGDRFHGRYATDVFTEEAVNIIKNHDTSNPLFLDLSHAAVHACDKNVLQVKNLKENDEKFGYIEDSHRRAFAGVLTALDDSVGKVIAALDEKKMLKNSIILFISDNGGATEDHMARVKFKNSASNWPLRGWKSSLTEGGVRGAAAIWSPLINATSHDVSDQMIHITDWLPTFYAAAGGDLKKLGKIDGLNQWNYLTGKENSSARREILLNINENTNDSALIMDDWKYIRLNNKTTKQYRGFSGRNGNYTYNMDLVIQSETNVILNKFSINSTLDIATQFSQLRSKSTIDDDCKKRIEVVENTEYLANLSCFQTGCLFNIKNDPCEFTDLSESEQNLRNQFESKINLYREELVPQQKHTDDPNYDPREYGDYWRPWVNTTKVDKADNSSSGFVTSNIFILFIGVLFSFFTNCLHVRN